VVDQRLHHEGVAPFAFAQFEACPGVHVLNRETR
jgi:hypothetical protein